VAPRRGFRGAGLFSCPQDLPGSIKQQPDFYARAASASVPWQALCLAAGRFTTFHEGDIGVQQFNWCRKWKKQVEPHLNDELVKFSVEMGMRLFDPEWSWDEGPYSIGRIDPEQQRVVKNKLSWYQPSGRCHWISFFSCAIGVFNYPDHAWQFVSGPCHTVPVGSMNGEHKVVMDILHFKRMTAEQSISHARLIPPGREISDDGRWAELFKCYIDNFVPKLRRAAASGSQR
jgi:hypothetical protein